MIEFVDKSFSDSESLDVLNGYVREWFTKNFSELTPPQKYSFKLISEKKNVLIAAPTGSGKTMSAFLSILNSLFNKSLAGELERKIYCIYVSPLRSLNNDIYKNLGKPLEEVYDAMKKDNGINIIKGNMTEVTIGVRTGDTSQKERRQQLAKPPNILITTPESLAILINSEKFMENMKGLEYIVVDEIHELANNKRGVHLSLSIERLQDMVKGRITRIGLGATLYPLEEAAKFLVGFNGETPRDCKIVDASWSKELDVRAMSPVKDMISSSNEKIEDSMYEEINAIIKASKTTLIFTNTRSGTERVVFNLKHRFKYGEDIAAHHSSLSRDSRLDVEELLKKGSLKCAVSSTSLELGVDIGTIENVIQLGSPKSVTRAIQRIGRAGHSFRAKARGEMIVLNRDDLVECTVMLDAALKKHLDSFTVPRNALDVLAQHIVGMSLNKKWTVDEAYAVVRSSYAYSDLERHDFISLLNYLSGKYVGLESRHVYGKIWYDEDEGAFGRRGMYAKPIYMLNLGTIPDEVAVNVLLSSSKAWIGNIEEEFLTRLKPGDIFSLGGRLYRFEYAKGTKCYVSEAHTNLPTIPPWFSEQLPLSYELADEIGEFRAKMSAFVLGNTKKKRADAGRARIGIYRTLKGGKIPTEASDFLSLYPIDSNAKHAIFGYFVEQALFAGAIPSNKLIVIETTNEEKTGTESVVFHSLFGRKINDALSRLVAFEVGMMLDEDVSIMVNDNGFILSAGKSVKFADRVIKDAISKLLEADIELLLKENIRKTELMKRRFRHVAGRSFMILRNYRGWKQSVGRQQVNAQILLKAAEEIDPNFPVIKETYREIFSDVMDLARTKKVLDMIRSGMIKYKMIKTGSPSPFAHTLFAFGHADVVLMKDRQAYLKYLHKLVMKSIKSGK